MTYIADWQLSEAKVWVHIKSGPELGSGYKKIIQEAAGSGSTPENRDIFDDFFNCHPC
jgi:hypothetical protein